MAGTGSVFSLFPPENATGNFVKVVQRVPVKITLDLKEQQPPPSLRIGMSVIPTLIEILDTSVANVALNHIQGSLSAGQEEVTWVLTSYLVANAVVIPM